MPDIEVVKPFNKTARGDLAEPGEIIPVSDTRASELKQLGFGKDPEPKAKQAPEPENKMAPAPDNKRASREAKAD